MQLDLDAHLQSVKKEVHIAVDNKLHSTIKQRAKEAIKKQLGSTFKDLIPKSVTYADAPDPDDGGSDSSDSNPDDGSHQYATGFNGDAPSSIQSVSYTHLTLPTICSV